MTEAATCPDCGRPRASCRYHGSRGCQKLTIAKLRTDLAAAQALAPGEGELESLAAAWTDGMGVGYKAGKEPLWIPPENPYRTKLLALRAKAGR